MLTLSVTSDAEAYREQVEGVKPEVPATFETIPGWQEFDGKLRKRHREGDVVVLISARRRTSAWQRELDGMPRKLASLVPPESFVVLFPCESEPPVQDDEPRLTQPDADAPFPRDLQPTSLVQ